MKNIENIKKNKHLINRKQPNEMTRMLIYQPQRNTKHMQLIEWDESVSSGLATIFGSLGMGCKKLKKYYITKYANTTVHWNLFITLILGAMGNHCYNRIV